MIITGIIATTGLFSAFGGWFKYLPLLVLLNSIASMIFAVLAAKPKFTQSKASGEDIKSGKASLLYFANFNVISEHEYNDSISTLIEDVEDVYSTMTKHIHNLGIVLTRKYHYLKLAYSTFLYGMISISILFTLLFVNQSALSARGIDKIQTTPFTSIYEPSGVVYVGDGEFLVVEDEPQRPFHLLKMNNKGRLFEAGEIKIDGVPVLLNDLEGITTDGQYIYATTSHSQNKSGNAGNGRMALVRYIYSDGKLQDQRIVADIKEVIVSQLQPIFAEKSMLDIWEGINIEGLGWSPTTKKLYIAFRAPLHEGKSLIASIDNPNELFAQQSASAANIELAWLNFDNNGIRAMSWDAALNGFFVVTGRQGALMSGHELWKWSGISGVSPVKLTTEDALLPQGTEGLSPFHIENASGMIAVVDDGNEELDLPGHYKLISMSIDEVDPLDGSDN